jgi:hypothetical protein
MVIRTKLWRLVELSLVPHKLLLWSCTSRRLMEVVEQRIVLKFLFLKGLRYKLAHAEFSSIIGEQVYSLSQMTRWICRFKDGDLSWGDEDRSGRPLSDLPDGICRYLEKFPFTSAKVVAKHFSSSHPTSRRILKTILGLKNFSRRCVPSRSD